MLLSFFWLIVFAFILALSHDTSSDEMETKILYLGLVSICVFIYIMFDPYLRLMKIAQFYYKSMFIKLIIGFGTLGFIPIVLRSFKRRQSKIYTNYINELVFSLEESV